MDVEDLLRRVAAVYANCRSYRDRGEVTSVTPQRGTKSVTEFETAWIRPDHFRFEFSRPDIELLSERERYVVWRNGGDIRSWWTVTNELEVFDRMWMALAGPSEIASGTARRVPELLNTEGLESFVRAHRDKSVVVGELEEGSRCLVLEGGVGDPMIAAGHNRIWIDERTLLIRRVDLEIGLRRQETLVDDQIRDTQAKKRADSNPAGARLLERLKEMSRTDVTIRYWPELDPLLGPEVFEFEPPTG